MASRKCQGFLFRGRGCGCLEHGEKVRRLPMSTVPAAEGPHNGGDLAFGGRSAGWAVSASRGVPRHWSQHYRNRLPAEALISLGWVTWSGEAGLLAADSGHEDRYRRLVLARLTGCVTYANRDLRRLTGAKRASRKPLTQRRAPERRARHEASLHRVGRWTCPHGGKSKSLHGRCPAAALSVQRPTPQRPYFTGLIAKRQSSRQHGVTSGESHGPDHSSDTTLCGTVFDRSPLPRAVEGSQGARCSWFGADTACGSRGYSLIVPWRESTHSLNIRGARRGVTVNARVWSERCWMT